MLIMVHTRFGDVAALKTQGETEKIYIQTFKDFDQHFKVAGESLLPTGPEYLPSALFPSPEDQFVAAKQIYWRGRCTYEFMYTFIDF